MFQRVFITGVSGYIGLKIARALADHPRVSTLVGIDVREPENPPDGLVFVNQDVRAPATALLKKHEIDTVIHAAYVLPPLHNKALMEEINVVGTKSILKASADAGVSHLLYTSSTTAYGFYPDNPMPLTEESPLRGNDDFTYAKNKKEIEFIFADFVTAHPNLAVTVLRPCFVVGPGFDNPLARYLQKKIVILPKETSPMQFVHEDDLIRVMIMCLEEAVTGIFNVAGEGTLALDEMVRMLDRGVVLHLPAGLMYPVNQLLWTLRCHFLTEFPSPGINLIRYPWIASSQKLVDSTGFQYQYTTRTAFDDFVRSINGRR